MIWLILAWWIGWACYGVTRGHWRYWYDFTFRPLLILGFFTVLPVGAVLGWTVWKVAQGIDWIIKLVK